MSSKRFPFTNKSIEKLPPHPKDNPSTDAEYSCSKTTGLRVLVGKSGKKKFLHRYTMDGRKAAIALGPFPEVSVQDARELVAEQKRMISLGTDPRTEKAKRRLVPKLDEFFIEYLDYQKRRIRSADTLASRFRFHVSPVIGSLLLTDINAKHCLTVQSKVIDKGLKPATINRITSVLHHVLEMAVQWGHLDSNPMRVPKLPENNIKQMFLSSAQLRALLRACESDENQVAGKLITFLALTGMRRAEAATAKWENYEVNEHTGRATLFLPHTKAQRSRYVFLPPPAKALLDGMSRELNNPYIFTGPRRCGHIGDFTRAWYRIRRNAGITTQFRIHDLRHNFASLLLNAGLSLSDCQYALGHSQAKMTERYQHMSQERMTESAHRVGALVQQEVGDTLNTLLK